jgi:hypothetical protein
MPWKASSVMEERLYLSIESIENAATISQRNGPNGREQNEMERLSITEKPIA